MRLLVLYQAHDSAQDHPGYHDGFCRLVQEGVLERHHAVPFLGILKEQGADGLWETAYQAARESDADAIFLHFFHGAKMPDPTPGIERLKSLPNRPTIFTSLGDPFGRLTKTAPRSFKAASALSDVTFLTGMGFLARQLQRGGSKNIVLMPHGCCQVRFSRQRDAQEPEFDVSFVGSRIRSRNPLSHYYWVSRKRTEFVEAATKRYGKRFGLFGNGWQGNPAWQGPVGFASQHDAYLRSAVALGGLPNSYNDYYTSDRVFNAVVSGIPFVDYWVRGVNRILENGRDWWLARSQEEMFGLCDRLIGMSGAERARIGAAARADILSRHTQYHRCAEMVRIAGGIRAARASGRTASRPELPFLVEAGNSAADPDSIVGWEG